MIIIIIIILCSRFQLLTELMRSLIFEWDQVSMSFNHCEEFVPEIHQWTRSIFIRALNYCRGEIRTSKLMGIPLIGVCNRRRCTSSLCRCA